MTLELLPSAVTALEIAPATPVGTFDAANAWATAAPAARPFAGDGLEIELAIAAPMRGGRDTVMLPPLEVAIVTVPVDNADATDADEVVTDPLVFPVLLTVLAAAFGAPVLPPSAPPTAEGVVAAGGGVGVNAPPAAPELDAVFTPLLSEPLLLGAELNVRRMPVRDFCASTEVERARTAAAHKAALPNLFVIGSPQSVTDPACRERVYRPHELGACASGAGEDRRRVQ